MSALARLGDGEVERPQATKVRTTMMKPHKRKKYKKDTVKRVPEMARRQVCTDLSAAGLAHEKLGGQPLDVLIELWKQLCPDQRYCPLLPKQVRGSAMVDQELATHETD